MMNFKSMMIFWGQTASLKSGSTTHFGLRILDQKKVPSKYVWE
jgi:hypothetical protein